MWPHRRTPPPPLLFLTGAGRCPPCPRQLTAAPSPASPACRALPWEQVQSGSEAPASAAHWAPGAGAPHPWEEGGDSPPQAVSAGAAPWAGRRPLGRAHRVSRAVPSPQVLTELKSDNQRLKDENGALIRVISKLSK